MTEALIPQENRDARAEVLQRLIRVAEGISGLEGRTAEEIFSPDDENARRELIKHLSAEQYSQLIVGINGVLRGKSKEEWSMDGAGVTAAGAEVVGAHIFPNHKDKSGIIAGSWEAVQKMNEEGRDLEDIGMMLGSLLVETHPFADGNGRTSRFVYSMIRNGYSEKEIKVLLSEDGREKSDMALSKRYINDLFEKRHGRLNEELNAKNIAGLFAQEDSGAYSLLTFPEGVDDETKEAILQGGRNDSVIFVAGILQFLHKHPEIKSEDCLKDFPERKILIVQRLLSALTKEQVEELAATYWDTKKQYTKEIIDIFVNPDKPEYRVVDGDKETRIIDLFRRRLAEGKMLIE